MLPVANCRLSSFPMGDVINVQKRLSIAGIKMFNAELNLFYQKSAG